MDAVRQVKAFLRSRAIRWRAVLRAKFASMRPRTHGLVVVVSDSPRSREAKIAYGLQQSGWQVVLLYRQTPTFSNAKYCVDSRRYGDHWEALYLASHYYPVAYHVFANCRFMTAATLIRYKPGKIVFDDYDVMAGMLQPEFANTQYPGELELEKYCLENADGICCRNLETQYAKRHLGYRFKGPRLLFLDGCWDFADIVPLSERDRGTVCATYCGNMNPEKIAPSPGFGDFLWLAKTLSSQEISFHLFPSAPDWPGGFENAFSEYRALENETPYFTLHFPVKPDDLIRQLAAFHLGIHVLGSSMSTSDMPVYTKAKIRYGISNKIFDYLDAGLLIIVYEAQFHRFVLSRYGVGMTASMQLLGSMRELVTHLDWDELGRRASRARSAYAVSRNAGRLTRFYSTLVSAAPNRSLSP